MRRIANNDNVVLAHDYNILPAFREVFLHASTYDSIEEEGVDFKSAVKFQKNIRLLTSVSEEDPILVHMNIPGGSWEDGLSIYDTIKECPCYVCILAYGKVQSASSIILQAADSRILMPNTTVLIHYGSISLDSEHTVASNTIKWNEKETKKMVDIFVNRCKNSPIAIEKKWKSNSVIKKHIESQIKNQGDWIMNAEEAVYYGFADGIFGSEQFSNTKSLLQ